MPNDAPKGNDSRGVWQAQQVYPMAVVCLLLGIVIGYLFRGSASKVPQPATLQAQAAAPAAAPNDMGGMPSLDDMKKMADTKAAPLLEKLKADPNDSHLLTQVGNIYKATHQFKDAAIYYDKALHVAPADVATRTEMASCMYYEGDVEGAIGQLEQALHYDPKNANSLFNLGLMKWQGRKDGSGAIEAWRELLKSNPKLSADRKASVQKLIAEVQTKNKS